MNVGINRHQKSKTALLPAILVLLFFCLYIPLNLSAQNKSENDKIDSLTYQLYIQQQWDDLIVEGKKAIHNGVDFYYLQMRIAIAFYEKRNYRQAIRFFENALRYDPLNQVVLEYLYFSYLFSGRDYDRRRIAPNLSEEVRERNKIPKQKILEDFYLEGTVGFTGNQSLKTDNRKRISSDTIYTETWYYNNLYYLHAGATMNVLPWLTLYQGYGRLVSDYSQEVTYQKQQTDVFSSKAHENEYYGNMKIAVAKGLIITPALHYNWVKYAERFAWVDGNNQSLKFDTTDRDKENFTISLSVLKDISDFSIEAYGNYSDFELKIMKQAGLALFYYPFGNLDLYSRTGLEYVWHDLDNYLVFNQLFGFRATKKTWVEMETTVGQLKDYAEKNSYVIYNTPEEINFKIEANVLINMTKHVDLSFRYRLMQRENSYLTYTDFISISTNTTKYFSHFLIGGITWRL